MCVCVSCYICVLGPGRAVVLCVANHGVIICVSCMVTIVIIITSVVIMCSIVMIIELYSCRCVCVGWALAKYLMTITGQTTNNSYYYYY